MVPGALLLCCFLSVIRRGAPQRRNAKKHESLPTSLPERSHGGESLLRSSLSSPSYRRDELRFPAWRRTCKPSSEPAGSSLNPADPGPVGSFAVDDRSSSVRLHIFPLQTLRPNTQRSVTHVMCVSAVISRSHTGASLFGPQVNVLFLSATFQRGATQNVSSASQTRI